MQNIRSENDDIKIQLSSSIRIIKSKLEYFYDEERINLNRLINQCAKDMKILSLFEENLETPKGPNEKQDLEFNSYNEFIE